MKTNVMSPETQGFVNLLQSYSKLYDDAYDALAAYSVWPRSRLWRCCSAS